MNHGERREPYLVAASPFKGIAEGAMTEASITASYAGLFGSFLERNDLPQPLSLALLERFDLRRSEFGFAEIAVLDEVDKATTLLPITHQRFLHDVVRAIAQAEEVRLEGKSTVSRAHYRRVVREAIKGLTLVDNLRVLFEEPSDELKLFMGRPLDFALVALHATYSLNMELAATLATVKLREFRMKIGNDRVSNILLANLVTLAQGKQFKDPSPFIESDLRRRYVLARITHLKSPDAKKWQQLSDCLHFVDRAKVVTSNRF
jgi:hypothetical protein